MTLLIICAHQGSGRSAPACVLAGMLLMNHVAQGPGRKAQLSWQSQLTHAGHELQYHAGGMLHPHRPWLQAWAQALEGGAEQIVLMKRCLPVKREILLLLSLRYSCWVQLHRMADHPVLPLLAVPPEAHLGASHVGTTCVLEHRQALTSAPRNAR